MKNFDELLHHRCEPCEGGVEPFTLEQANEQLTQIQGWRLTHNGKKIRKDWKVKDFMAGINFFHEVARQAEEAGHHPDIHLADYKSVWIEIGTHAIDGLSLNDFALAAKIDLLPIDLG